MTVACLILACVPYLSGASSVKVDMQDNLRLVHQQDANQLMVADVLQQT